MSKNNILAKIAISVEEMDSMWEQKAEMAQALQYLLLMQDQIGLGAAFEKRSTSEVNKKIAEDMGMSVATLQAKRREWTKSGALAEARAFLSPLALEQQQMMADMVIANSNEIMMQFLKDALNPELDTYARSAAWKLLKTDVLLPALSNQKAEDDGADAYIKNAKDVEYEISEDDDAAKYLEDSAGEG